MKNLVLTLGIWAFAVSVFAAPPTPADEVKACAFDAMHLADAHGSRYLTMAFSTSEERKQLLIATNYVAANLSRIGVIYPVQQISPTLLRLDVSHYATDADGQKEWLQAWDRLWWDASGHDTEKYLHITTQVAEHGKGKIETVDGGWVDLVAARQLAEATGSYGALLRADDFVFRASQPGHYYDFAGIPSTRNEMLKLIGLHQDDIDRLSADRGASLERSDVTRKGRNIAGTPVPLGIWLETFDVASTDGFHSPLRRPIAAHGSTPFQFDASEVFTTAPNGLWRMCLYNNKGERQDAVPPNVIAADSIAVEEGSPDARLVTMQSCSRCHPGGNLHSPRDDFAELLRNNGVASYDPSLVDRVTQFHNPRDISRQIKFAQETYTAAVHDACNCTPDEAVAAFDAVVKQFGYDSVTPFRAWMEMGRPGDRGSLAFLTGSNDPVILMLKDGHSVLRADWADSFSEAMLRADSWRAQKGKP